MTSRRSASTNGRTRLAAIHESPGSIALVIVDCSEHPTVVLSTEQRTRADVEGLLAEHAVSTLIRVVPSCQTLVRVARVPDANSEETLSTLALMGEGEFAGDLPAHRRGVGVLPGRSESGDRRALLTAWPVASDSPEPFADLDERWVAEIAALARIRGVSRRPAWSLDASRGSVSVLAERNGHISCRAVLADHDTQSAWEISAGGIIDETTRAVGSPGAPISLDDRPRVIELEADAARQLRSRVRNVPEGSDWLDRFGLSLGAILIEIDDDPLVRSFASLRARAKREDVPTIARLGVWLGVPTHGAIVVVVSLILVVLGPLGLAAARVAILDAKVAELADAQARREALETRAAMYAQLDRERLPMTKMLADIAGAAPVTPPDLVLIDIIRLTNDRELYIEGIADTPELVSAFQRQLNESGLFQQVTVMRSEASRDGVDFTLTAHVAQNPYRAVARSEVTNFVARSTAVRLYGEEGVARGSGVAPPNPPRSGSAGGDHQEARRDRPTRPGAGDEDDNGSTRGRPARVEIPETLTDEALLAMSRAEVMMGFARRRNVVQSNPDLDEPTKQRLEDEYERMKERLDELRGGG